MGSTSSSTSSSTISQSSRGSEVSEIQTYDRGSDHETRYVFLLERMLSPFATHWAVKVGISEEMHSSDVYYELNVDDTDKKQGKKTGRSALINGARTGKGVKCISNLTMAGLAGETTKSNKEIEEFNLQYLASQNDGKYTLMIYNCQTYAANLIRFVTDNKFTLPRQLQSGSFHTATTYQRVIPKREHKTSCEEGHVAFAQTTLGPAKATVKAWAYKEEKGAYFEAVLAEAAITSQVVSAKVGLNANTGMSIKNYTFKLSLLGFGINIGREGVGASLPFVGLNFGGR